jgi:Recombinase
MSTLRKVSHEATRQDAKERIEADPDAPACDDPGVNSTDLRQDTTVAINPGSSAPTFDVSDDSIDNPPTPRRRKRISVGKAPRFWYRETKRTRDLWLNEENPEGYKPGSPKFKMRARADHGWRDRQYQHFVDECARRGIRFARPGWDGVDHVYVLDCTSALRLKTLPLLTAEEETRREQIKAERRKRLKAERAARRRRFDKALPALLARAEPPADPLDQRLDQLRSFVPLEERGISLQRLHEIDQDERLPPSVRQMARVVLMGWDQAIADPDHAEDVILFLTTRGDLFGRLRFCIKDVVQARHAEAKTLQSRQESVVRAREAKAKKADRFAQRLRDIVDPLYRSGLGRGKIADELNRRGIETQQGSTWTKDSVKRLLERLALND